MPFNIQTFKTRALSAVVFAAIMLIGFLWNHWTFFILFSIIHIGCWLEFQKLMGLINPEYRNISSFHKYGLIIIGCCFMLFMAGNGYNIGSLRLHDAGFILLLLSVITLPFFIALMKKKISLKALQYSATGLLYISVSWALMIAIRSYGITEQGGSIVIDNGRIIPLVLIASIWINDTMAYIVGSFIGKKPFSKISPKKTWEGTIGGAILCIAVVSFAGYKLYPLYPQLELSSYIIISSIAAIAGTAGDLLESKVKRMAKVKDSGAMMPGHGGFLDRFDSLIVSIPLVWLYIILFAVGADT